ncbi:MAG: SRPBCC family protein [Myxococcota bacterium]
MRIDFQHHLGAVDRSVASLEIEGKPARAITLVRTFDTTIDDLWDAVTNPERLPRWFLPVSGDLRLGGRFQLEGNAGGEITTCNAPRHLAVTWEIGGDTSWVEVRLSSEGPEQARLALTHTALHTPHWDTYGSGATGVGWELGIMALALYLADPTVELDEATLAASPEGKALIRGSSERWGKASIAAGEDKDAALASVSKTTAFFTGEAEG